MARTQRGFRCTACGREAPAFEGRCPGCGEWNTLEPYESRPSTRPGIGRPPVSVLPGRSVSLREVDDAEGSRIPTSIPEFDRVLGGGIVPGSLVLVGGDPGVGKSTLVLQAAEAVSQRGHLVVYVCGEESPRQVRMRAARLGVEGAGITMVPETSLDVALATAASLNPGLLIVDSIQSVYVEGVEARTGGPAQLGEAGARLLDWAKSNEVATIVTGHVTKAGEVAGPRLLEHLVDAVLYFEGTEHGALRVLRATKNRFGATDEVGVFEMTGAGLQGIENPGAAFLDRSQPLASGCAVTAIIEGSRPIAVEVQALAVPTTLPAPRRVASGVETARLHLMLAVLARRAGLVSGNMDVVLSVAGGLRLRDPGSDLALAAALASAIRDVPPPRETAFLAEVALSGGLRPAQQAARRMAELGRLGYSRVVVAEGSPGVEGISVVRASNLADALAFVT